MLLPKNKFRISIDPSSFNSYQYDIKISIHDVVDIVQASKDLETYGLLLPDMPQDFIDEMVFSDVSSRAVSIFISHSNLIIPFDLINLRKHVIFADEGNGLLKIFLK